MDWSDEGIILSARKHGESAAILSLFTRAHGRHSGLVHGGAGRRKRGLLQPGNEPAAVREAIAVITPYAERFPGGSHAKRLENMQRNLKGLLDVHEQA